MNNTEPKILPLHEFAIPIYQEWDKKGIPCPHANSWLEFNEQRRIRMEKESLAPFEFNEQDIPKNQNDY